MTMRLTLLILRSAVLAVASNNLARHGEYTVTWVMRMTVWNSSVSEMVMSGWVP